MDLYWNKLAVAAQQVIALCSDELTLKAVENPEIYRQIDVGRAVYPLSRFIRRCLECFDTIDDSDIIARVKAYGEGAQFIDVFANGSLDVISKETLLSYLERRFVGRLSLWAPLDNLSWVVVVDYENMDMGGIVPFRFLEAESSGFDRNRGLERLLEIADNGGVGQPIVVDHNL